MTERCCKKCDFWSNGNICCRFPPRVVISPDGRITTVWPTAFPGEFCGEFKIKVTEPEPAGALNESP